MEMLLFIRGAGYVGMFLLMLSFEWRFPFVQSAQKKTFRVFFHFGISLFNTLIISIVLASPVYAAVLYTQEHKIGLAHLFGLGGAVEIVAAVVVLDFWDYWMHLVNHKIGFLWRFHKAHHSDMEVDVTTASRFHIGELLISGCIKYLMIFIWGPSLLGLVAFEVLLTGFSQFHHSNITIPGKIQDGMEKLIVTPRMHRCHHALHKNCFNTNFATIFSIWDRLFGTYHHAVQPAELKPIGVFSPRGPATMQLLPFLLTPVR